MVSYSRRIFMVFGLAAAALVPAARAQKPPSGPPSIPTPPPVIPSGPTTAPQPGMQPVQPDDQMVMFISGKISTSDGSALPLDASIQRICTSHVRQQVYASSQGSFSMQTKNATDSFVDASGDGDVRYSTGNNNPASSGIPQRDLAGCELRTVVAGFRAKDVVLAGLTASTGIIDVGSIVVERIGKVNGATVDAATLQIPKDALKAYEKGMAAANRGKPEDARADFEKAVGIYPKYARAWYQLGSTLDKSKQSDAARAAYLRATASDPKYLPPYLPLAYMAFERKDWTEVVDLTKHVLDRDPVNHTNFSGYIVDLDPLSFGQAYFYNAAANYYLNNMEASEASALKAERHTDVSGRYPQLHLLLAEIFSRKGNYAGAINELELYLEILPHAKDADAVREELASLQKMNAPNAAAEKPVPPQ